MTLRIFGARQNSHSHSQLYCCDHSALTTPHPWSLRSPTKQRLLSSLELDKTWERSNDPWHQYFCKHRNTHWWHIYYHTLAKVSRENFSKVPGLLWLSRRERRLRARWGRGSSEKQKKKLPRSGQSKNLMSSIANAPTPLQHSKSPKPHFCPKFVLTNFFSRFQLPKVVENLSTDARSDYPKDPAVLKTLRDSELLRCGVFTLPPLFTTVWTPFWEESSL